MSELTKTSLNLTHDPHTFSMVTDDMKQLERFTVLMYSRGCSATSVDEARLQLFTHASCTLEALPPTKAALYQHVKRAILQACFFWKQSVSSQQVIPYFAEWGWKLDEKVKQWVPLWTDLPDASSACSFLLHRGCQNHVKATASVPGQAYVAHLTCAHASVMTDVSTLTMNNGLQYAMVYHMWYTRVISYYNVGQAQLINVTEIWYDVVIASWNFKSRSNFYQGPTWQTKFDQHKYWTAADNNASISMKSSSAYFAIWVKVPLQSWNEVVCVVMHNQLCYLNSKNYLEH